MITTTSPKRFIERLKTLTDRQLADEAIKDGEVIDSYVEEMISRHLLVPGGGVNEVYKIIDSRERVGIFGNPPF